jgi:serine/threonine protein kinase
MNYEAPNERHKDFVVHIKDYFNQKENKTIFQQRNTIKRVAFEGGEYLVKSFKTPHIINKIAYGFFREGKAKKSYLNSMKIRDFVPLPIGYIEFKQWGMLYESYFISAEYHHDFTIRQPLTTTDHPNKEAIYKSFAHFTHQLHKKGVLHLDYSPGNILIKEHDGRYEFKIIDVNRMLFKKLTTQERLENFAKLWATDEDLTIIIKEYATINKLDRDEAIQTALKASQKHKDKKNFKKRLKGKKVVD